MAVLSSGGGGLEFGKVASLTEVLRHARMRPRWARKEASQPESPNPHAMIWKLFNRKRFVNGFYLPISSEANSTSFNRDLGSGAFG